MRRADKFKCLQAKCREKPWKSLGSNLRHQIASPIGSTALYRLSQIPIYKNRWFIGEFQAQAFQSTRETTAFKFVCSSHVLLCRTQANPSHLKLSLSATRQPFTVDIALLYVFSLSNSLFFVSFLRLPDRSHAQEQAGSMPLTQAVAPIPSHNRIGSEKVQTFNTRTHRNKPFDRVRFVSVLWFCQISILRS